MQILKNPNFNFVRWRWHAIGLSLVVIAIGLGSILTRGLQLGVEFEGGTIVILKFDRDPDVAAIRSALASGLPGGDDAIVQRYGEPGRNEVMIRVSEVGAEVAAELSRTADSVVETVRKANVGNFTLEGTEIVGPIVGDQLKR